MQRASSKTGNRPRECLNLQSLEVPHTTGLFFYQNTVRTSQSEMGTFGRTLPLCWTVFFSPFHCSSSSSSCSSSSSLCPPSASSSLCSSTSSSFCSLSSPCSPSSRLLCGCPLLVVVVLLLLSVSELAKKWLCLSNLSPSVYHIDV